MEKPYLLNVVTAGKTPKVNLKQTAELNYHLTIMPVLLLTTLLTVGDTTLAELAATGRHPESVPIIPMEQIFARTKTNT